VSRLRFVHVRDEQIIRAHWRAAPCQRATNVAIVLPRTPVERQDLEIDLECVWLLNAADRYAEGRMVSSLEGGYDLDALACSVEAHLQVLLDH
jgi:hypothetical protein